MRKQRLFGEKLLRFDNLHLMLAFDNLHLITLVKWIIARLLMLTFDNLHLVLGFDNLHSLVNG